MSEELHPDVTHKPRSALGDVTNQIGKRGFSSISTSGVKSGDGCKKDEGVQLAKKTCLGVENSSYRGCEIKKPCPPTVRQNTTSSSAAVITGDVVKDSSVPTRPLDGNAPPVTVEAEVDERTDSAVVVENALKENVENSLGVDDGDDTSVDILDLSKDEYLDCSRLLDSQESRCGLERCNGQKRDGFSTPCIDAIKACPCSFCMKAAYIWSDLHYQDTKGRVAAIEKSQKEASILVHKNNKDSASSRHGQGTVAKCSNLEPDLTGRWMSLFLHMEGIFDRERIQLETSLSTLKELRDNCKIDLEK